MSTRRDVLLAAGGMAVSSTLSIDVSRAGEAVTSAPVPPRARKIPKRIEQLGRVRVDDYAWLRDPNWKTVLRNPASLRTDIRTHLLAENAYSAAMLAQTEKTQAELFAKMKARLAVSDVALPVADGPWEYYERFEPGAHHQQFLRRPLGSNTGEQLLFDAQARSRESSYLRVYRSEHSRDHTLFAWTEDTRGS